jgi:hypothetical protein
MATKHQSESVDKAMALLCVHYENVLILCSRYDPTTHSTNFCEAMEGNDYAIRGHVDEFLDTLRDGGPMACGPDCDCGASEDDDDDVIDGMGDEDDGSEFNR